jgi:hypothetical protein
MILLGSRSREASSLCRVDHQLPLRGSQCAPDPCNKVVSAQSLGRQACGANRAAHSQGCCRSKTGRHSAPNVDRRYRIQLVTKGGCQPTRIRGQPNPRTPAKTTVPAGTQALVRSPLALRCSSGATALHTLIHQRHPTPSCGGPVPYRGENREPGKDVFGELDPAPGIREQPGSSTENLTASISRPQFLAKAEDRIAVRRDRDRPMVATLRTND